MTQTDFALMAAVLAGALMLAAVLGWRGEIARADVAQIGGLGSALGTLSVALYAS